MSVPTHNGRNHLVAALLLTGVVAGCYWNSLSNGFVLDDHTNIVENAALKDASAIPRLATTAYFDLAGPVTFYYRPLATLSFFADYALWGANPVGFHLTNLLLHMATSLLVYAIFARLVGAWAPAVVGSTLFAAHPALAETVTYISGGRNVLLSADLFLIALWCFIERRERPRQGRQRQWLTAINPMLSPYLATGLLAYTLALFAKESAAVLVLLLPLTDWARAGQPPSACPGLPPGARGTPEAPASRGRLPLYAAVALITAGYLVVRLGIMHAPGLAPAAPLGERLRAWPYATWLHLRLLVLPLNLSSHYVFDSPQWTTDPMVVFPLAVIASLLLGLLWLWLRGKRLACLGGGWVIVALAPVSNLVPFAAAGFQPVAEHYLYLPAVGFVLLLALVLSRLRTRGLALGLAGVLVVASATLIVHRNPVWHDDLTLWRDTVEKMPASPWAHANLGLWHGKRGDLPQALREYAWAADLFVHDKRLPTYAVIAHYRAGEIALKRGRLERAAQQFQEAIRLNPQNALVLANLGVVYQRQGRGDRAIALYRAALAENPEESEVWANLGTALAAAGQRAQALEALETARDLNPREAVIHHNLGTLYAEEGRLPEAVAAYQTALRLNPALAGAHESLSHLYARQGRHAEAAAELAAARQQVEPARDRQGP